MALMALMEVEKLKVELNLEMCLERGKAELFQTLAPPAPKAHQTHHSLGTFLEATKTERCLDFLVIVDKLLVWIVVVSSL